MTACVGFERSWRLAGDPRSASQARLLLREALTDPLYAPWLDDAQLALSEIVTNVVLHAHTSLVLTIRAEHERLRIDVRDDSVLLPIERIFDVQATTGRGMALIRELTTEFGVEVLPEGGKVVWFVMGRSVLDSSRGPLSTGVTASPGSANELSTHQGNAVHVTIGDVAPDLVQIAVQESEAMLREMLLYAVQHPDGRLSPADLLLAEAAHDQAMLAIDAMVAQAAADPLALMRLHLWVTPRESLTFAALLRMYLEAERLAGTRQLLFSSLLPESAAVRQWMCREIIEQVAGRPATDWADTDHVVGRQSEDAERVKGWDGRTVTGSAKAVVATDAGNRIVAISASLAAALGWRVEDLVGRRLNALVPARLRQAHVEGHRRHLMTGESRILGKPLQLPMLCSDGTELVCGLVITQEGTQVGHPVFVAAVTLPVGGAAAPVLAVGPVSTGGTAAFSDLTRFSLGDTARMAGVIRALSQGHTSLQGFGTQFCHYLEDQLRGENGARQTVLVEFYATVPFGDLPPKDQVHAAHSTASTLTDESMCMTLLATAGRKPAWNDRNARPTNRVMPLIEASHITEHPLLAAILQQARVDVGSALNWSTHLRQVGQRESYRQFHLEHTEDLPLPVPPEFVAEHGLRSILGFGGGLPLGGSFAVVLFTGAEVSAEAAALFGTLAVSTSLGGFSRPGMPFLEDGPRTDRHHTARSACQNLAARDEVLTMLLEVHERVASQESELAARNLERAEFQVQRYAALARALQASLLPPDLPVIEGLETGTFFRPAGDGSEIGGDFYDVFPTSGQRWGLVLGDVSGKGAQAAALTALARHTVRAAAYHSPDACQVLERLDDAITAQQTDGRYLTALFGFISTRPGELTIDLALGGHPQPLVLRADGRVESVGVEGSALGLFPHPTLTQTRIVLHPGDVLVAFSDGITEARNGNEEYGEERLRALLAGFRGLHPHAVAASIGHASLDFQFEVPHDDLAVVALRCI